MIKQSIMKFGVEIYRPVWTALLAQEIIMAENAISGAVMSSACLMRG
jgi:hypothetical protein